MTPHDQTPEYDAGREETDAARPDAADGIGEVHRPGLIRRGARLLVLAGYTAAGFTVATTLDPGTFPTITNP